MPAIHLLIKPASSLCNLRCQYCFYLDSAENRECKSFGIMNMETLENILEKALAYAVGECTIAYQGGEPTLAGLDFFRKSIALQKKYNVKGIKINNAIQTNLFDIHEEWAEFFHENHFLVGVSLDGTKETNDVFRKDTQGNGCFNTVMKNLELLKKHKVEFNILTVVNSQTAKKIQSIYSFYKKCGFDYLQFIPCLQPFHQENLRQPFTLSAKEYGAFLVNLFDIWYRDFQQGTAPHIRQFENYMEMLLGYPPESCGMSGICSMQNVIEADGEVYPCDFYVLDAYKLGNLNQTGFEEINQKRAELRFLEQSAQIAENCMACTYLTICRGGCKRYCEPLSQEGRSLNLLCEGYRKFFAHALPRLREMAALLNRA